MSNIEHEQIHNTKGMFWAKVAVLWLCWLVSVMLLIVYTRRVYSYRVYRRNSVHNLNRISTLSRKLSQHSSPGHTPSGRHSPRMFQTESVKEIPDFAYSGDSGKDIVDSTMDRLQKVLSMSLSSDRKNEEKGKK